MAGRFCWAEFAWLSPAFSGAGQRETRFVLALCRVWDTMPVLEWSLRGAVLGDLANILMASMHNLSCGCLEKWH
jgi:hypothetical protein